MKIYVGTRMPDAAIDIAKVTVEQNVDKDGVIGRWESALRHFPVHSPDGFEWGYAGSGPADLALAILCDFTGREPHKLLLSYQDFKNEIVANLPRDGFRLREDQVEAWVLDNGPEATPEEECRASGHEFTIIRTDNSHDPVSIVCSRCGKTWGVTEEPRTSAGSLD